MRAIAWLLPLGFLPIVASIAEAQVVNIAPLQTNLQVALCQNDWHQALQAIAPLIGSPGITNDYRLDLIQLRRHLENWRAADAAFANVPGCEGTIPVPAVLAPAPNQPLNWERAVDSVSPR